MGRFLDKKYRLIKALDLDPGMYFDEPLVKGFVPLKNDNNGQTEHCEKRADDFNDLVHQSQERGDIVGDLEDFVNILKKRNITPILFTMPCYGPYRELLDRRVREQNRKDIQGIADKFHIPCWDYSELSMNADCFFNCDHLNGRGAAIFSGMLNQRIGALTNPGD